MDVTMILMSSVFKGLSPEGVRTTLEVSPHQIQHYSKGEIIFHQMSDAKHIGIVLRGTVQGQKSFPNGSRVNVTDRVKGDIFGAAAAFAALHKYPCDVVAIEASTILMFDKKSFLSMMQQDAQILQNVLTEISTATTILQQRLELYSYSGIAQKVAFWLLMKRRHTGEDTIRLPSSITKWAAFMNVSRPSLHREIKNMEKQGLIRYAPHSIDILDSSGLEAILDK